MPVSKLRALCKHQHIAYILSGRLVCTGRESKGGNKYAKWVYRDSWDPTWKTNPKYRTVTEMRIARKKADQPHATFDVDGDGTVGSHDLYLSTRFDDNGDGVLQDDEQHELRKAMVADVVTKYRRLPHPAGKDTEEMLKRWTKNLDTTVDHPNFVRMFEHLKTKTMCSSTYDSTKIEHVVQPRTVAQRENIMSGFTEFDENGDGIISHDEFRAGVSKLKPGMPPKQMQSLIKMLDKDGDGEIDYVEFAKQYGSANTSKELKSVVDDLAAGQGPEGRDREKLVQLDTFREVKPKMTGLDSREALLKERKRQSVDFARSKLKDINERYHRSHLQLHPQLLFFNKDF